MQNRFSIELYVEFLEDGNYITAYSPQLDLSSFGNSVPDALDSFTEMLEIWIMETKAEGTFEEIVKEKGIKINDAADVVHVDYKRSLQTNIIKVERQRFEFA